LRGEIHVSRKLDMKKIKRTKRKDGLRRQSEIMNVALRLFAEKGYSATSIDDIIETAGIARGTFYLHFTGKSDVLAMIVESYLNQMYAIIEKLDISMNKPVDEIKGCYREAIQIFSSLPSVKHFMKVMLRDVMGTESEILDKAGAFFDKTIKISALYIAQAQKDGKVIQSLDPVETSVCIVGAVKEILLQWTISDSTFDLNKAVDTAIELFFRGILV
jgi:TetR/AcrR family fatty acid metabolism transcriptional regulator